MKRYRIGEVSAMLDISVETLRYLERVNLLAPQKDNSNNYRYYSLADIEMILDYKKYRQIGFSTKESVELISQSTLQEFSEGLAKKQAVAERMAHYYEAEALKLKNFRSVLDHIEQMEGRFILANRPECYTVYTRFYDAQGIHCVEAKRTHGSYEKLTENYTFVEHIYRFPKNRITEEGECIEYDWGLTIKQYWVSRLKIHPPRTMEHKPTASALFTIVRVADDENMAAKILRAAWSYMQEHHFTLSDDPTAVYLSTVHENGQTLRYYEVWLPVQTKESSPEEKHYPELRGVYDILIK